MARQNNYLSYDDVKNLSRDKKIQILQQASKTANTRLAALEKSNYDTRNSAYTKASKYLDKNNRTRFYQGKNYENNRAVNAQLRQVLGFLNNEQSTVSGVKKARHNAAELRRLTPIAKQELMISYDDIKNMGENEKRSYQLKASEIANARMDILELKGIDYYAIENAKSYLEKHNKKRFDPYEPLSAAQLNRQLLELSTFINSKSSTLEGLKSIEEQRLDVFRKKGLNINQPKKFFQFLASKEWEALGKRVASNQIIDDMSFAFDEGKSLAQIKKEYDQFLQSDQMTFDQIQMRRAKFRNRMLK